MDIPQNLWSFSVAPNGWYRAYMKTIGIAQTLWLRDEYDVHNTVWMTYFKENIVETEWASFAWHALVECAEDRSCRSIDGIPLNPSKWYIDDMPSFRGSNPLLQYLHSKSDVDIHAP